MRVDAVLEEAQAWQFDADHVDNKYKFHWRIVDFVKLDQPLIKATGFLGVRDPNICDRDLLTLKRKLKESLRGASRNERGFFCFTFPLNKQRDRTMTRKKQKWTAALSLWRSMCQ